MAAEALEIRMARLEGAYQQIDHRLATIEVDIRDLRGEIRAFRGELVGEIGQLRAEVGGEIGQLRSELVGEIGQVRGEIGQLRAGVGGEIGQLRADMRQQFFWVIGLIVATILVPVVLRFLNP